MLDFKTHRKTHLYSLAFDVFNHFCVHHFVSPVPAEVNLKCFIYKVGICCLLVQQKLNGLNQKSFCILNLFKGKMGRLPRLDSTGYFHVGHKSSQDKKIFVISCSYILFPFSFGGIIGGLSLSYPHTISKSIFLSTNILSFDAFLNKRGTFALLN